MRKGEKPKCQTMWNVLVTEDRNKKYGNNDLQLVAIIFK